MKHTIKVPSGTVPATHKHPTYGYCVIDKFLTKQGTRSLVKIVTNNGTALVPWQSLNKLNNDKE